MLLAAAAYKIADTAEAIDTLTRMASQRQHVDRLLVTGMGENTAIEFSPTDPTMVSLTNFNGIELWDVKRGVRLHSRRDADGVDSSAFSPDGRILVYTQNAEQGKQGVLWFYEDDRVQEIPLSLAPDEPLGNLTFSPDGKLLGACIGQQIRGQRIQLWSLDPSGPRHSIPLIHGAQCAFGFRGGSRELAYTNGDDIVTWDIAASRVITSKTPGPPKSKRPGPRMSIGSDNQFLFDSGSTFAVAPDGRSAMYRGNEGDDAWWDFDRQEALAIGMSTSFPNDLSFTPDSRLATMVLWGGIMLFDVARRMPIAVYSSVDNRSTALSPDGRMIATINDSGLITLIDTSLHQGIPARADRVGIQPDNEHLTTVSSGKVTIYSLGNHESTIVRNPEGDRLNGGRVENLSQNGLRYAFMDDQAEKKIRLLDLSSLPASEVTIEGNHGDVLQLSLDPNGDFLASVDKSEIIVWSTLRTHLLVLTRAGAPGSVCPDRADCGPSAWSGSDYKVTPRRQGSGYARRTVMSPGGAGGC